MSFGFSIVDFVAVAKLAQNICQKLGEWKLDDTFGDRPGELRRDRYRTDDTQRVLRKLAECTRMLSGIAMGLTAKSMFKEPGTSAERKLDKHHPISQLRSFTIADIDQAYRSFWTMIALTAFFCYQASQFIADLSERGKKKAMAFTMLGMIASLGIWGYIGVSVEEEFLVVFPITMSVLQIALATIDALSTRSVVVFDLHVHSGMSHDVKPFPLGEDHQRCAREEIYGSHLGDKSSHGILGMTLARRCCPGCGKQMDGNFIDNAEFRDCEKGRSETRSCGYSSCRMLDENLLRHEMSNKSADLKQLE